MTRSIEALWHGRLALAFRYHPAGPLLFVACAAIMARPLLRAGRLVRMYERCAAYASTPKAVRAAAGVMAAIWVVRLAQIALGGNLLLW